MRPTRSQVLGVLRLRGKGETGVLEGWSGRGGEVRLASSDIRLLKVFDGH